MASNIANSRSPESFINGVTPSDIPENLSALIGKCSSITESNRLSRNDINESQYPQLITLKLCIIL